MKRSDNVYIRDVVNNVLLMSDDDDYLKNIKRYQATGYAKRFLQEMTYLGSTERVRVYETDIPPSGMVEPPLDFVDYVRLSIVDERGWLQPLFVNKKKSISYEYLQDDTGELITDDNGFPLKTVGTRVGEDYSRYYFYTDYHQYDYIDGGAMPGIKGGYVSTTGEYRWDEEGGVFWLSRVPADKVVLEYISDPIMVETPEDLTIHKAFVEPLEYWIYYKYIEKKRGEVVPAYEKENARRRFWSAFKLARRKSDTKISELIQYLNSSNPVV